MTFRATRRWWGTRVGTFVVPRLRSAYTLSMVPEVEKVLASALELPAAERAELADRLLESLDEDADDLIEEDRQRLHEAIHRSEEQFDAGLGIPADQVLARLR